MPRSQSVPFLRPPLQLPTVHGTVIGPRSFSQRCTGTSVVCVSQVSEPAQFSVSSAPVASASVVASPRCVLRQSAAFAPVEVRCVELGSPVASLLRPSRSVALRQSPRLELTPALRTLRRAARMNKCLRIAERLARIALRQSRQHA